jgi:hypothetical protein
MPYSINEIANRIEVMMITKNRLLQKRRQIFLSFFKLFRASAGMENGGDK